MSARNAASAFGLLVLGGLALAVGCAGGTGSRRFSFDARIAGTGLATSVAHSFTNEKGWVISLSRADVTLGPVYLNVIPPLTDSSARLFGWFVRSAWAHGEGHLDAGRMVGQVLSQVSFDALSADLVSFPERGTITQEEVRTAEVWFYPEPGVPAETTKIDTVALDVAGTATRADESVRFRGKLVLNDDWIADQTDGERGNQSIIGIRQVRGVPASFFPVEGGQLQIRFDITRLFRGADFANLKGNPTDADGTKALVQKQTSTVNRDQVMTNLYEGLRETGATYSVRWLGP